MIQKNKFVLLIFLMLLFYNGVSIAFCYYEDFENDFQESTSTSLLNQNTTRSSFDGLEPSDSVYLWNNYGVAAFDFWTHSFNFRITDINGDTSPANKCVLLMYTNQLGTEKAVRLANYAGIKITLGCISSSTYCLRLQEAYNGDNNNADTTTLSENTNYYGTVVKSEKYVGLWIFSDSDRSTLIDHVMLPLTADWSFQYLEAPASMGFASSDSGNDGYIEYLNFNNTDDDNNLEVGIWYEPYWVNDWERFEIPNANDSAIAFYDNMFDAGFDKVFDKGWKDSNSSQWVAESDTNFVDSIDIAWFEGHGKSNSPAMPRFTLHDCWYDIEVYPPIPVGDFDEVEANNTEFGNTDLEWALLYSCTVLNLTCISEWDNAFEGVHGLCGFDTVVQAPKNSTVTFGDKVGYYLKNGYSIGDAWKTASQWWTSSSERGVVYSAEINLPGGGTFDYKDETVHFMWPDYGQGGYTLNSINDDWWWC